MQPFNFNLQQDLKIAAFWENPEMFWLKFSKNSANLAEFATFCKKSAKNAAILTKQLRLENGAMSLSQRFFVKNQQQI